MSFHWVYNVLLFFSYLGIRLIEMKEARVCSAQMVREELQQENTILTMTTSQCGRGKLVVAV